MTDNLYGLYKDGKCPHCKKRKLEADVQYAVVLRCDLNGKPIFRHPRTDKKIKASNARKAAKFEGIINHSEVTCVTYVCGNCGWASETIVS